MGENKPFARASLQVKDHIYEIICHDFDSTDLINGKMGDVLYRWTQTIDDFTTQDMTALMDAIGLAVLNAHIRNVEGVFTERIAFQWPEET